MLNHSESLVKASYFAFGKVVRVFVRSLELHVSACIFGIVESLSQIPDSTMICVLSRQLEFI